MKKSDAEKEIAKVLQRFEESSTRFYEIKPELSGGKKFYSVNCYWNAVGLGGATVLEYFESEEEAEEFCKLKSKEHRELEAKLWAESQQKFDESILGKFESGCYGILQWVKGFAQWK